MASNRAYQQEKVPFYNKLDYDKSTLDNIIEKTVVTFNKDAVFVKPSCNFFIDNNHFHQNDADDRFRLKGFSTPGSLMMIDGKPKSRKTTFAYMMAAAALSKNGKYENIVCTMDPNNWIMIFDTEQNPSEFLTKMHGLKMWSGDENLDRVKAYNLNLFGHNPELKIQAINKYATELDWSYRRNGYIDPRDKIGLIILDHIGDLVNNENNKEEVKEFIGWASKLATDTGATVCIIIHQNKNDNQATGMLGYDSAKKVSSYIKTFKRDVDEELEEDMSPTEVTFKENRFGAKPFKKFIFNYVDDYAVVLDHKAINYNFNK